jgi:hypothetical protein
MREGEERVKELERRLDEMGSRNVGEGQELESVREEKRKVESELEGVRKRVAELEVLEFGFEEEKKDWVEEKERLKASLAKVEGRRDIEVREERERGFKADEEKMYVLSLSITTLATATWTNFTLIDPVQRPLLSPLHPSGRNRTDPILPHPNFFHPAIHSIRPRNPSSSTSFHPIPPHRSRGRRLPPRIGSPRPFNKQRSQRPRARTCRADQGLRGAEGECRQDPEGEGRRTGRAEPHRERAHQAGDRDGREGGRAHRGDRREAEEAGGRVDQASGEGG